MFLFHAAARDVTKGTAKPQDKPFDASGRQIRFSPLEGDPSPGGLVRPSTHLRPVHMSRRFSETIPSSPPPPPRPQPVAAPWNFQQRIPVSLLLCMRGSSSSSVWCNGSVSHILWAWAWIVALVKKNNFTIRTNLLLKKIALSKKKKKGLGLMCSHGYMFSQSLRRMCLWKQRWSWDPEHEEENKHTSARLFQFPGIITGRSGEAQVGKK